MQKVGGLLAVLELGDLLIHRLAEAGRLASLLPFTYELWLGLLPDVGLRLKPPAAPATIKPETHTASLALHI
jgi:hypothetical protein